MELYVFLGVVLLFIYVTLHDINNGKIAYLYVCLIFTIFSANRYGIGTDYFNYEKIYDGEIGLHVEVLFYGVMSIFKYFNVNYFYFSFFISIITYLMLFYSIYKIADKPFYSFIVLYFFGYLFLFYNISRQGLVISIFSLSIVLFIFKNKGHSKYIILYPLIHSVSVILLPIVLGLRSFLKKRQLVIYCFIIVLFFINIINPYEILSYLADRFLYFRLYKISYGEQVSPGSGIMIYLWMFFIVFVLLFYGMRLNRRDFTLLILSSLSVIFSILALSLTIFSRLEIYFVIFKIVFYLNFFSTYIKYNYVRYVAYFLLFILSIYSFYNNVAVNSQGVYPYVSFI